MESFLAVAGLVAGAVGVFLIFSLIDAATDLLKAKTALTKVRTEALENNIEREESKKP